MQATPPHIYTKAALVALVILQLLMLGSLYTRTPPHPPVAVALFGIAPFLSAALAVASGALVFGATGTRSGAIASVLAALLALLSFGPQKWADGAIGQIWPAVLLGQISAVTIFVSAYRAFRGQSAAA